MNENGTKTANSLSFNREKTVIPKIFQNEDLLTITGNEKKIPREKLINKLNHLNFVDGRISIIFSDNHHHHNILVNASPDPCAGEDFTCRLIREAVNTDFRNLQPRFLMIDDRQGSVITPLVTSDLKQDTLTITLPEESLLKTVRFTKRHFCRDVYCEIVTDQSRLSGTMVDFTPDAFSIQLSEPAVIEHGLPSGPQQINLLQNGFLLFSGACRLIRYDASIPGGRLVYAPLNQEIQLFPQRRIRNPRRQIAPSFTISFRHPFFPEHVERDIFDVSTSGFSIQEHPAEQTLMTGMIIPELLISYAGVATMKCSAQVVYRKQDKENGIIQSGLAITDMDVLSYSRFNHLVGTHLDHNARVSTTVDMDALWEFFFDTGFIYGEKYQHLYPYRNAFKETYRKLYQDNPDIARHFTYEKNGKIYGHIAMIHGYEPSWVIHHFSAKPLESKVPGMLILRQIIHYLNGCYRFHSTGIDYVMTYYRPDNRIIDKIFGGFARDLQNPHGSSLDLFSYVHWEKSLSDNNPLAHDEVLYECRPEDFEVLKVFYDNRSGGLLMDSFGLHLPAGHLKTCFNKASFKRHYQTFCLCREKKYLAFFIVNQSDLGLNLSDLLNGIKIFVVDEKELEWKTVKSVLHMLAHHYSTDQIPLLVYPDSYLPGQGIEIKKRYQLWIMKTNPYAEEYTEYMRRKFRIKYDSTVKE